MILITGASGFLGGHLTRQLSRLGNPIRALYHQRKPNSEELALPGVTWLQCDLLDIYDVEQAFEGITQVYHCAAIVSYRPAEHAAMLHFNVESTANVVDQALVTGIEKMVYVSSIAAIGRGEEPQKTVNEDEQWGETVYKTAYGLSKHLAETEVWRGIGEGLCAVIINPGIILGEGNWNQGSAELVKIAWNEFPFYTNGATAWVDVLDVVALMVILMHNDIEGERFIVSENNYSFREIMAQMAESLQRKKASIYAGKWLTNLIWWAGMVQEKLGMRPLITKETAANAHTVTQFDNAKLLRMLPKFQYTPVTHTISRITQAFLREQSQN